MKNKLTDLTDHLFAQLERLGDEQASEEQIKAEIARAGAITSLAREIINTGRLAVDAARITSDLHPGAKVPALLGLDRINEERGNGQGPAPHELSS